MTKSVDLPPESAWWTASQFAAQLGIEPIWLENRCAPRCKEPLPHQRVGRLLRFSPEDRAAIKAMFARGTRSMPEPGAGIDLAKGLAGLRKLDRLTAAKP